METNITKRAGEWLEAASPGGLFRRFASLKIGVRLIVCFVAIVLLMVASHLFTLWQFDRVRRQEERMHQLDQESLAVLGVHASLLSLRDRLDEPAAAEEADRFASEADALRHDFLEEMERANQAIRTPAPLSSAIPR